LLWGDKDVAYKPERFGREFRERIPKARWMSVPNSGHYPQEEQPQFVVQAVRAFAQEEIKP
jgi:pimeloyl-ACP methyl ester carboxylesterase